MFIFPALLCSGNVLTVSDDKLLPFELRRALDVEAAGIPLVDLRDAARRLSDHYRQASVAAADNILAFDDLTALAYAATRMPATLAAARVVFHELTVRSGELKVETLLDLGSGPATTLWAADPEFSNLEHVCFVERDAAMRKLGKRLAKSSPLDGRVKMTWSSQITDLSSTTTVFDLVVVSYLLTELDEDVRMDCLRLAWNSCGGALVVILPGSAEGYNIMLAARGQLVSLGASIIAPCPHSDVCPLDKPDWCHFGARLNRSNLHRRLKEGSLGYEDEKYIYVIATKGFGRPAAGRVIARPHTGNRQVHLRLCEGSGVVDRTLTKRNSPEYRQARKLRWGDAWELSSGD